MSSHLISSAYATTLFPTPAAHNDRPDGYDITIIFHSVEVDF
jgi:hypothetical protein